MIPFQKHNERFGKLWPFILSGKKNRLLPLILCTNLNKTIIYFIDSRLPVSLLLDTLMASSKGNKTSLIYFESLFMLYEIKRKKRLKNKLLSTFFNQPNKPSFYLRSLIFNKKHFWLHNPLCTTFP